MDTREKQIVYLGLDIGSGSVGWAVSDEAYRLRRYKGKDMWGVRLFDEAQTAAERRLQRVQRRRLQRRKQRLALLQEIFKDEIAKVDPAFFQRMESARILPEDKGWKHTIFGQAGFTDKQYHAQYPTIYHLRRALMEKDGPFDVRLVYLALHHILKKRGHFLYADLGSGSLPSLDAILEEALLMLEDELAISLRCADAQELKKLLTDATAKLTDKQRQMNALFSANKKQEKEWVKALCGGKADLSVLFDDPALAEGEQKTVEFREAGYEDKVPALEAALGERIVVLEKWRSLYNWGMLQRLLGGARSISEAKVRQYEQNRQDLQDLKAAIRKHGSREQYDRIFRDPEIKDNYAHYTGAVWDRGKKINLSPCNHEAFCKFIQKELEQLSDAPEIAALKDRAKNQALMLRLASGENSVIPYQLHRMELEQILKRAAVYLPFLQETDADGLTPAEKIRMLLEFRIPYYVGPLNAHSPHSWFVRRESDGAIRPWNFAQKVDARASAQRFIDRMTAQCSYMRGCDVLPLCSPSYERYMALNELNPMTIEGEPISVSLKQEIFEQVFMREKKPTIAKIVRFLNAKGMRVSREDIAGIDVEGGVKSSMKTTIALHKALGERYDEALAEEIVQALTYFGDDRNLLREKLRDDLGLNDAEVRGLMNLRCAGWGRLSGELLHNISTETFGGQGRMSLLDALYHTNETLMSLLSERYAFRDAIDAYNREQGEESLYEFIDELYLSPAVKRQIRQTVTIVRELRKAIGHDPKKVFVEMVRGEDAKKERKPERKSTLMACYRALRQEEPALYDSLERVENDALRRDKLYLYYAQMGRCMYTGERIDLGQLLSSEALYDIDHIYPQSRVKDDSIDNRVLVKRTVNEKKTNIYPLEAEIVRRQSGFWKMLMDKGLISKKKYERLTRRTGFSDDELTQFAARQLVETRQSSKAVAQILKRMLPESEIVYVKAGLVSEFRRSRDMLKLRESNDLHHAKDAYLNIVVGNVYNTEFTHSPTAYIRDNRERYTINLEALLKRKIERGGIVAWDPASDGSIAAVRKAMEKNSPLVTVMPVIAGGGLFDQQPKNKREAEFPLKKDLPIEKYGGYKKVSGAAFMLVEHTVKKKRVRSLIDAPLYLYPEIVRDAALAEAFCREKRELDAPKVIIPLIRMNALISLNGFRMYVTGRTGNYLTMMKASQLMLSYEWERYLKKVVKAAGEYEEHVRMRREGEYRVNPRDGVCMEKNLELYDVFAGKMEGRPYCERMSGQAQKLRAARGRFEALGAADQCSVLRQILNLFTRKGRSADLSMIGCVKNFGVIYPSRTISECDQALLIHQSPTGLFEQIVDLKKL